MLVTISMNSGRVCFLTSEIVTFSVTAGSSIVQCGQTREFNVWSLGNIEPTNHIKAQSIYTGAIHIYSPGNKVTK